MKNWIRMTKSKLEGKRVIIAPPAPKKDKAYWKEWRGKMSHRGHWTKAESEKVGEPPEALMLDRRFRKLEKKEMKK